jgi:hypothetical protein
LGAQDTLVAGNQYIPSETNNGSNGGQTQPIVERASLISPSPFLDVLLSSEPSASMLGFFDETNQAFNIDSIMQEVFNDYQLDVEFWQSFQLENGHFAM